MNWELTPDQAAILARPLSDVAQWLQNCFDGAHERREALVRLTAEFREASLGLQQALEGHVTQLDALRGALEQEIEGCCRGLRASNAAVLESLQEATDELVQEWADEAQRAADLLMEDIVEPFQESVQEGMGDMVEAVVDEGIDETLMEALDEFRDDVFVKVDQMLQAGLSELASAGTEFVEDMAGRRNEAGSDRSSSGESTKELDALMQPLQVAIDRVRGLANMVGIPI
jgi:hypothetical protein